jgi:arylsulfatase A-like enzyme
MKVSRFTQKVRLNKSVNIVSIVSLVSLVSLILGATLPDQSPSIIIVITDDQGYGDLACHTNPHIRTPNLDRLAEESLEHTHFYVSPVCAPTRASLMTGRYNYRTGVVDTYLGRAMMYPEEITLAELLSSAGYKTGIFGKWHLGDNYPLRAMDQGFHESLVHRGGGIGQPSDPPGNRYFNPILMRNGADVSSEGYCTDIFFRAAEAFIKKYQDRPFFAYIATNAPHTPLQVSETLVRPYLEVGLDETTARVYGMITNIDENMGKLMARLDGWGLRENTILIFMTDNGHQQARYSAGLRGRKASVFEGGVRVPFFVRWPKELRPAKIDLVAAHIDIVPTLIGACGVPHPENLDLDGINLMPFWKGEESSWPNRLLYFQAHRGDVPEPGRACAIRSQRYKLVQPEGWDPGPGPENPKWMLFDMVLDPGEQNDISHLQPERVKEMKAAYRRWYKDVSSTRGYDPPAIALGTEFENPVTLTRQDWRGPEASWGRTGLGHWVVSVQREGYYSVRFRFPPAGSQGLAKLRFSDEQQVVPIEKGTSSATFAPIKFAKQKGKLEAILHCGERKLGVHYVDIRAWDETTNEEY